MRDRRAADVTRRRSRYDEEVNWQDCEAVDRDPGKLGGVWCFTGTRMPVAALFEHLDKGATVDEFLEWFPEVTRGQVHAVLEFATDSLKQPAAA